jgi:hypothetical protein
MRHGCKETGQLAYEAYASAKGWYDGERPLPFWEDLEEDDREAYREAAHAVMRLGWADAQKPRRH